ncbi:hypothetical protein Lepto7375DRAFT_5027 [Leptolyngbya sp. PCC 7375]|nr:hypothetical protein Lepto7375DRAFT_5027 [Leptolyngbya sp. PCC 7375]
MKGSRFLAKANDPGQSWVMYFLVGILSLGILGNGISNFILEDLAGWLTQQINLPKLLVQLVMVVAIAIETLAKQVPWLEHQPLLLQS